MFCCKVAQGRTKFDSPRSGAALVELAVALPFLLLILVGVVDFARVYSTATTIANAARAGAQFGAQNVTTSGDTALINQAARQDAVDAVPLAVTSSRVCRCSNGSIVNCVTGNCGAYGAPRVYVLVTASKSVKMLIDYPGLPKNLSIGRTATLRVQ